MLHKCISDSACCERPEDPTILISRLLLRMCGTQVAPAHSFGLPLRMNGMHTTQSDHERLTFDQVKLLQKVSQSDHEPWLHVLTLLYNMCWFNNVRTCSRYVRCCLNNIFCWKKCLIIKTFFQQKNVSQTSSNMPATRSNIVKPTHVM